MNSMRAICVFGSLLLLSSTFTARSADWPQWRGPERTGHSGDTGLLAEWPAGGPPLAWKATGLGGGYTTPSVAQGRIYGMGYKGENELVWALDEKTGKQLWSSTLGRAEHGIGYPEGSRATPTVDQSSIFVLGAGGRLACLDAATGKEKWHRDFSEIGGKMMSDWGYSESPLIDGDHVICTPGGAQGTIAAFNKQTGALAWQTKAVKDEAAYSSLIPAEIQGVRQYIQLTGKHVIGVAPQGQVLWSADRPGRTAVIPTPIYKEDHVFVTSGYGVGCSLFKISKQGNAFTATQVYANRNMKNHHGGVVLVGNHLYGANDAILACLDFATGAPVWDSRATGKGSISYADGRLYFRNESKGTVFLIEATPSGYKEHGRFEQPDRSDKNSWPHPVIANGMLYLRDQDLLLCYNVKP